LATSRQLLDKAKEQMKQYEVTYIAHEDLGTKGEHPVKDVINSFGGKITGEKALGQKVFAYPIKKEKSGYYDTIYFEMDPAKLNDLNRQLTLKDEIIRHLIVISGGIDSELPKILARPEKTDSKEAVIAPEIEEVEEPVEEPEKVEEKLEEDVAVEPEEESLVEPVEEEKEAEEEIKETEKVVEEPAEEPKKVSKAKAKKEETIEEATEEDRLKALDEKLNELLKD